MNGKILKTLSLIFLILIGTNFLKEKKLIAMEKNFIYESPNVDFEDFFKNNKEFIIFNENIYSIQNDKFIIITSRYYIPMKKIPIKNGDYLLSKNEKNLFFFNKLNCYLFIFSKNKLKLYKKLEKIDALDFEIYKNKFYFLLGNKIIIFDKDFKISFLDLKENFKRFKIFDDKVYLLNNKKLKIINLYGENINELKENFNNLISFDINFDKKIFILDNNQIKIFDKQLKFIKKIELPDIPDEMFFDISRAIVLYFKNSGIKVLEPQIEYKTINNLNYPSDITIDEEGNIFVLSSGGSKVLVYDKNLNFKFSFGDKILKHPQGIFYYNGKVLISDTWNNKIRIFDKKGNLIFSFGEFGEKDKNFSYPGRIKVYNGLIYVCDVYNHKIKIFNEKGELIKSYGKDPFEGYDKIVKPKDILLKPTEFFIKDKNLYVVDEATYQIIEFNDKLNKFSIYDNLSKILEFNNKIYAIGSRWKYIYEIIDNKLIPIFSLINNHSTNFNNIIPYSFLLKDSKIYILDRLNSKLYVIEGSL